MFQYCLSYFEVFDFQMGLLSQATMVATNMKMMRQWMLQM